MSRERIDAEKAMLNDYFGRCARPPLKWSFIMNAPNGEFHSLDCSLTSQSGRRYHLHLRLDGFPTQLPKVYVKHPTPLKNYLGIPMREVSAVMHVLSPDHEGCTQICHYGASQWRKNISLVKVVLRAKVWLDAYECHLRTGRDIDTWLNHAR